MSEVQERSTVQEVAQGLAAMCKAGQFGESGEKYWADDVVSLEPMPGDMARIEGKAGVRAKGEWWAANHEVHGVEVEGPYVHGDQFVVRFKLDVTPKGGQRTQMDEVALYTVKNGKIAEERFFFGG
ncbi:MAG: nuclear transport factor 2 family protein [Caulobacterales bacterium]|nr:nuclear transport factor 2 family protein [Caulobacterales bacterium]